MKKSIKKGFTLVELLVVIAIIAILSIVGIVGYVSFTNRARVSNDTTIVTELNRVLQAEHVNKKPSTMQDVVDEIFDAGFDLTKLTPTAAKHHIVYDFEGDRFYLLNESHLIVGGEKDGQPLTGNKWDHWKVIQSYAEASDAEFSHYLGKMNPVNTSEILNVTTGIDVGSNTVAQINYTGGSVGKEVVIRTNSQFTNLAIVAPNDSITHYGNANTVNITSIKFGTYEENGSVSNLNVKAGKVELKSSAVIGKLAIDKGATSGSGTVATDVAIEVSGSIFETEIITYDSSSEYAHQALTETEIDELPEAAPVKEMIETVEEKVIDLSDENTVIKVGTAEYLMNLAFAQSTGILGDAALNIELTNDIDLSGRTWVPFGAEFSETHVAYTDDNKTYTAKYPFHGVINGNNHSIIGLSNGSYDEIAFISSNTHTSISGYKFGFIATVKGDVEIKNLSFKKVDINASKAKNCAAVIGNSTGVNNITLSNVDVLSGTIRGKDKAAGLIGYIEEKKKDVLVSITVANCEVNASIIAENGGYRAGGLIGYISLCDSGTNPKTNNVINVLDCSFLGTVSAGIDKGDSWIGAITSGISHYGITTINVRNFTTSETAAPVSSRKWGATAGLSGSYMNEKNSYLATSNGQVLIGLYNTNNFRCSDAKIGTQENIPWSEVNVVSDSKSESNYRISYNTKVILASNVKNFTINTSGSGPNVLAYSGPTE